MGSCRHSRFLSPSKMLNKVRSGQSFPFPMAMQMSVLKKCVSSFIIYVFNSHVCEWQMPSVPIVYPVLIPQAQGYVEAIEWT